ncbi:MFS transporter [Enterobacillus tribolii]|uniref:Uncharacterized protein n=1 Tax=Enterobacillus tribolii TaxID=1487935 RepID=A0A370QNQ6_9GAMM|nr:MFS transporter [Enterobacillus tribolii]MBW7981988.1 MFS transporter [Enterobacillus tribolii]RDK89993.1 hypothetical protein C8D90_106199 [Enterobacillus tribolii]
MIQIALLLLGGDFLRSRAKYLWLMGVLWSITGCVIFLDGLDGAPLFPLKTFGALLLLESLVTLSIASSGIGAQKAVLYFKGGIFLFVAVSMLLNHQYSNMLLAFFFSATYAIVGLFILASAWVVRFPYWRTTCITGVLYLAFALFLVMHPHSAVSFFLGGMIVSSSVNMLIVAKRLHGLKWTTSVFELMLPVDFFTARPAKEEPEAGAMPQPAAAGPLNVHVWTPEGSAKGSTLPRPVINRYIAAVDVNGVISTGHAALEASPLVYISLYPAQDIDRSPSEFLRLLKATHDNDVPGIFQPDYITESTRWCASDRKITFRDYNLKGLLHFWQRYQQDMTYNLTYRNCSSSTAYALESALDGVLSARTRSWHAMVKMLFMPELWIAAQVRQRATTMAWTPGLVMDYARALNAIVHPVPRPWYQRMPWGQRAQKP